MSFATTESKQTSTKRQNKSENAYRTISEVADELGVANHVLRFWESKFEQIQPLKRSGGRRYYKAEDIAVIRHIQSLLHDEGYTIRGVQTHFSKMSHKKIIQQSQAVQSHDDVLSELKALRAIFDA